MQILGLILELGFANTEIKLWSATAHGTIQLWSGVVNTWMKVQAEDMGRTEIGNTGVKLGERPETTAVKFWSGVTNIGVQFWSGSEDTCIKQQHEKLHILRLNWVLEMEVQELNWVVYTPALATVVLKWTWLLATGSWGINITNILSCNQIHWNCSQKNPPKPLPPQKTGKV